MRVEDVVRALGLEPLALPEPHIHVTGGYCSDLLSRVMAEAEAGTAWITYHRHLNVVAVAKLKGLSMVILARGPAPGEELVSRARGEGVNLSLAPEGAFEVAGKLYLLLHGEDPVAFAHD